MVAEKNAKKRTFLFELSQEEKLNPSKRVAFCEKIPQLPKIADPVRKEDETNSRSAFCFVVDGLWRRPGLAVACQSWLQGRIEQEGKPRGDGFFTSPPSLLKHLDIEWVVQFVIKHSSLTRATLESVSVYDPESPYQLLAYSLRCNVHLKLDEKLIDKELMGYTMCYLMEVAGNRLHGLRDVDLLKGGDGGIGWAHMGVYNLHWGSGGKAWGVTHRPSQKCVKIPSHVVIDNTFVQQKNYSDYESSVFKKPTTVLLHTLFEDGEGPHERKQLTGASQLMADAITAAVTKRDELNKTRSAATGSGASETAFKGEHKVAQQREAIRKARTAFEKNKQELMKKRTVSFENIATEEAK